MEQILCRRWGVSCSRGQRFEWGLRKIAVGWQGVRRTLVIVQAGIFRSVGLLVLINSNVAERWRRTALMLALLLNVRACGRKRDW